MNTISIAIVDDDAMIVDLLRDFLSAKEGIEVLLTAGSGKALLALLEIPEKVPDVLLLDLRMQEMDGIEVAQHLRAYYPAIRTIVISSYYKPSFTGFMFKTGVSAFLPKGISPVILVDIIKAVHEKGYYFLEDQMDVIRDQLSSRVPQPVFDREIILSDREIEVLRLISYQKTAKEIGGSLFITQRTVVGHKNNLFAKTGTKNIAGLVIFALQHNIIRLEELPRF